MTTRTWLLVSRTILPVAMATMTQDAGADNSVGLPGGSTSPHEQIQESSRIRFSATPLFSINRDEGVGAGASASLTIGPRATNAGSHRLSLRFFVTHRQVQRHELRWDANAPYGAPVVLHFLGGLYSTRAQNFCGYGAAATCDPRLIPSDYYADAENTADSDVTALSRRYYQLRFIQPYFHSIVRWPQPQIADGFELLGSWRIAYQFPGDFSESAPYANSLYAQRFPNGEPGLMSSVLLGLRWRSPPNDPLPYTRDGVEVSSMIASPLIGSAWDYGGFHLSAQKVLTARRLKNVFLIGRFVLDTQFGDPPSEILARTSGLIPVYAFGGQHLGRGIRERKLLGKIKAIQQSELRSRLGSIRAWKHTVDIALGIFFDVGWIGYDWDQLDGFVPGQPPPASTFPRPVVGLGVGARFYWNQQLYTRIEIALSPSEQNSPYFYLPTENIYFTSSFL